MARRSCAIKNWFLVQSVARLISETLNSYISAHAAINL
ncbi:hypothetical protein APA_4076 [Pseudanabaena sp. lw0831]|nr:hypothetical protein APA_4076 [Pseudanabaena sp. lw0831]